MRRLLAFFILSSVKVLSWFFYKAEYRWIDPKPENTWKDIRLMVFLNHTSLYEPLFVQIIPFHYLWHLSGNFNIPGADITLDRPIVGLFWKLMIPNISSITRKKDESWEKYLASIKKNDVVMIAPEGRMKRPNGLDKYGKEMSIRGGIADIIEKLDSGKMILCLSGGLHHVQSPGEHLPRLFKTIKMNLVSLDILEFKSKLSQEPRRRKVEIIEELQRHINKDCPR